MSRGLGKNQSAILRALRATELDDNGGGPIGLIHWMEIATSAA